MSLQPKLKKKRFRMKHQKVKLFRANEPLLSVFMWGVNHTINELSHVNIPVMLLPDDFRAYSKVKVDNHLFNKENMPSHFKVKEYCPLVFRNLRERFGIDDFEFKESLTRQEPEPMGQHPSGNKSPAHFYLSYDKLYVLKTLTSEEVEQMHNFLTHYHSYIVECHGRSLLTQYLAMYRLTVDNSEHYLVIMRSVFSSRLPMHRKFDLKGSRVDREASERELEKQVPTFKDMDFVKQQMKIYIGEEAKSKLLSTLTSDVEFLTRLHLMDYSLLLGVHECDRPGPAGGACGEDGQQLLEEEFFQHQSESENTGVESDESGVPIGATGKNWGYNTPPDSPPPAQPPHSPPPAHLQGAHSQPHQPLATDIYAIPSSPNAPTREIYYIALIDVLTHYGVRKQAAKAAKTVKYGSNVEGISTCGPDQYGKRFIEFISRAIE